MSFTSDSHQDALLRRRIRFVVLFPRISAQFKKGTHDELREELFNRLQPLAIRSIKSREEYDTWLLSLIKNDCWQKYSKGGLESDRWAYFAKLINILVYEIVSVRGLMSKKIHSVCCSGCMSH